MTSIELTEPIHIAYVTTPAELRMFADRLEALRCGDPCKIYETTIGKVGNRDVIFSIRLEQ